MYQIENEYLKVTLNPLGASLWSVLDKDNTEYLWQGDPQYWGGRAPNLFPYVGRLTERKYQLFGKTYEMDIHGFAKDTLFEAEQHSDSWIVFQMKNSEETYRQYPYEFTFEISYRLEKSKILIEYRVENRDEKVMYFGLGGHPGIQVPLEENLQFEDYWLEFDTVEAAKSVELANGAFIAGGVTEISLEEGRKLSVAPYKSDDGTLILQDMSKGVVFAAKGGYKAVRLEYPKMPYLALWHVPDAPYLCIEPWGSLPSRDGVIENLATQPGLIALEPGKEYKNPISIEILA